MIDSDIAIQAPGGFVPVMALGQEDGAGNFALVSLTSPLPTVSLAPDAPVAIEGATSSAITVGPFSPAPLAPVYLTLSGDWQGSVRLTRSTDGGITSHHLTLGGAPWGAFSGNACEPVWVESEKGADLYLELAPVAGTIEYRVSQ